MTAKDTIRHDGDTWDLASSVGATATAVAASARDGVPRHGAH